MKTTERSQVIDANDDIPLTSPSHPLNITCEYPRYLDKVDIAISYNVSRGMPFRQPLPLPVTQYFHPCYISAWPSGRTFVGRKVLASNGRILIRGHLNLPRLKGKQKKSKNENSLSESERNVLNQLCKPGEQPSDVQMQILKTQTDKVLDSISKAAFPYCVANATTSDLSVAVTALETYVEIPHPPSTRQLRQQLESTLCELYGGTEFGLQRLKDRRDRDLEDHHDVWRIRIRGESVHIKLYPKGDYYRIEVRRKPTGLRASSHSGVPNMNAFWHSVDLAKSENDRILAKITTHLNKNLPRPMLNVTALKNALTARFRKVGDSFAFEKLIESWAITGVYDPQDQKLHPISSYHRKKLVAYGFCEKHPKNPDVPNGGRYFYILYHDWETRFELLNSIEVQS